MTVPSCRDLSMLAVADSQLPVTTDLTFPPTYAAGPNRVTLYVM